ncbi:hypothetical protein BBJ28_00019499 [Nothophytophthora sp. Chile5]|nr:hypothetical protein BBJ28_00019499 [Nothophytophthora sp. Chile5]
MALRIPSQGATSESLASKRSPLPSGKSAAMGLGLLPSPQASDYLPSLSPTVVYSTAQTAWSPSELQTLRAGLAQFPAARYDNVTRYIKVAATLPRKCVRDVAFKARAFGSEDNGGDAGAATVAAKRMRIEPYQEEPSKRPSPSADELEETRLAALLRDNVLALHTIRTNLLNGKADDNRLQMHKFRDNCQSVRST